MKLVMISAGLAAAALALAGTARTDTFIFSDDDFPDTNWVIPDSVFNGPGANRPTTGGRRSRCI
jgi:hypothetical protein